MNRGTVLLVAGLAAIAAGVWIYQSGAGWHMMGGSGHMRHMDIQPLAEVKVPELSGSVLEGKQVFDENCSACHGENAAGNEGAGPPLVHITYEPNHHGDQAFYLAVERGVRQHHWTFGDMPPVQGPTRGDVGKIIAYIRTLQEANGIR